MSAARAPRTALRDEGLTVWSRALRDTQDVLIAQIAGRVLCEDLGLDARAAATVLCAVSEMGELMPRPHSEPGWLSYHQLRRPGAVGLAVHTSLGTPGTAEQQTEAWTRVRTRRREPTRRLPIRLGLATALDPAELRSRTQWIRRSENG